MRFCYMELAESDLQQTIKIRDMAEINQYRKELRDKIIAYAMREFHQCGVKAVKMDEISRGLRVSKRTVYEIFGDKEFKVLGKEQISLITQISENVSKIKLGVDELLKEKEAAKNTTDTHKQANAYCNKVKPLFDVIREGSDALEMMVDDELWPMTKYRELLFTR